MDSVLFLIIFSWYLYLMIQQLHFGQMGDDWWKLWWGTLEGTVSITVTSDCMVWFCSCSSCWLSNPSNAILSAKSWLWTMLTFLSWFDFWERTYFVVSNSVPFHFQVSAHFQVFYNIVFVFGFHNTAICWTVENIVEEWNLVFIARLQKNLRFYNLSFLVIRFGTEWLFTISSRQV